MGVRNTRKSETLLAETAAIASKAKKPHVNPDVLFSGVSMDDLDLAVPAIRPCCRGGSGGIGGPRMERQDLRG
jgi:hypothetical protein